MMQYFNMMNMKKSAITRSAVAIAFVIVLQLLLTGIPSSAVDTTTATQMAVREAAAVREEPGMVSGVSEPGLNSFMPGYSPLFASDGAETYAEEVYVYAIVIEFGSFSFYYDYGVWDPATLTYKADPASSDPSHSTVEGSPGWYGFDGISNKITVKNASLYESEGQKLSDLKITISYSQAEFSQTVRDSVKMTLFTDKTFTNEYKETDSDGKYSFTVASGSKNEFFISLSGRPTDSTGNDLFSDVALPIGYITLQVSIPVSIPEG